ncbi:MAG: hypothetical protein ACI4J6_01035 [Oscillospiraceae bacterium]
MKNPNKIIAAALSLVCLAGCSAGSEPAQESETTAAVSETVSETSAAPEAAETSEETTAETETTEAETPPEPLTFAWEEKPIISSLPFTIDHPEPSDKECSEKLELVEKMLEQLGLWEPPQTEIIDGEEIPPAALTVEVGSFIEKDFDGNGQTEGFYYVHIGDGTNHLIYSDNEGNGHDLLSSKDKYMSLMLIDYGSFSHIGVVTIDGNYIYAADGKNATELLRGSGYYAFDRLVFRDSLYILSETNRGTMWIWDAEKQKYSELSALEDESITAEIRSELSDAIVESSNNMAMLHAKIEYLTNEYYENGNSRYLADHIYTEEEIAEADKNGYVYEAVAPEYAKNEEELYDRIRRSISEEFVSDEKMKELLFGEFEFPVYGDHPKVTLTNYRTVDGQLEMMQPWEPLSGYELLPENMSILAYNEDSALAAVSACNNSGDIGVIAFYMVRSEENGWQLYNMEKYFDLFRYSYWEDNNE